MICPFYGCPMKCRNMKIHRAIYWKMDKYYQDKEEYIPSKLRRVSKKLDEDVETEIKPLGKKSPKINYEKLKEYQSI